MRYKDKDVTPKELYLNRRQIMQGLGVGLVGSAAFLASRLTRMEMLLLLPP